MKKQLIKIIRKLRKNGHNFKKDPVIFTWEYEGFNNLEFVLMVKEKKKDKPMIH